MGRICSTNERRGRRAYNIQQTNCCLLFQDVLLTMNLRLRKPTAVGRACSMNEKVEEGYTPYEISHISLHLTHPTPMLTTNLLFCIYHFTSFIFLQNLFPTKQSQYQYRVPYKVTLQIINSKWQELSNILVKFSIQKQMI